MSFHAPLVTEADKVWALRQKPAGVRMHSTDDDAGETVDDGDWLDADRKGSRREMSWHDFVVGEIEAFERHFAGEFKTYGDWSALWRKGWWPKRREDWKYKHLRNAQCYPFFRRGSDEFAVALRVAKPAERALWDRIGVAQFAPDDPRLKQIRKPAQALTERSRRMMGDAE